MDLVTIRRAEPDDLGVLVPLFEAYRAFYKCEPNEDAARAFLSERLKRGESVVFLAIEESTKQGIGFVQLYPVFSSLHMRRAWILNDLFVDPDHRGHHIAKRLMDEARALAVETGATTIALETAPDNQASRQLYESLGYRLEQSFLRYELTVEP